VELGEGIQVPCKVAAAEAGPAEDLASQSNADVTSLSSMLSAKWIGGTGSGPRTAKREPARAGQIRSFRIVKMDAGTKKIEIEIAS
jgi:small subunit ribosomal protein S1